MRIPSIEVPHSVLYRHQNVILLVLAGRIDTSIREHADHFAMSVSELEEDSGAKLDIKHVYLNVIHTIAP